MAKSVEMNSVQSATGSLKSFKAKAKNIASTVKRKASALVSPSGKLTWVQDQAPQLTPISRTRNPTLNPSRNPNMLKSLMSPMMLRMRLSLVNIKNIMQRNNAYIEYYRLTHEQEVDISHLCLLLANP